MKKPKNFWGIKPLDIKKPVKFNIPSFTMRNPRKRSHLPPFGDFDRDNVPNFKDCQPFDYRYQDNGEDLFELASKTTNEELQAQIASSKDKKLRKELTKNPNISDFIKGVLANDVDKVIRESVKRNQTDSYIPNFNITNWFGFDAVMKEIECYTQTPVDVILGILEVQDKREGDIVRISGYNNEIKNALKHYGFFEVPESVTWSERTRDLPGYIEFAKKGRDIKRGVHSLEEGKRNQDVRFMIDRDLKDKKLYDEWYNIYEGHIKGMPRGRVRAPRDPPSNHFGIYAFKNDEMLGGRMVKKMNHKISASYNAFPKEPKYLNEIAYAKMMEEAVEQDLPVVSLGKDTNFYGYHLSIGVYKSKAAFGFKPRPYNKTTSFLQRIYKFDKFQNPCMFFSYMTGPSCFVLQNNIFVQGDKKVKAKDYPAPGGVKVWNV